MPGGTPPGPSAGSTQASPEWSLLALLSSFSFDLDFALLFLILILILYWETIFATTDNLKFNRTSRDLITLSIMNKTTEAIGMTEQDRKLLQLARLQIMNAQAILDAGSYDFVYPEAQLEAAYEAIITVLKNTEDKNGN